MAPGFPSLTPWSLGSPLRCTQSVLGCEGVKLLTLNKGLFLVACVCVCVRSTGIHVNDNSLVNAPTISGIVEEGLGTC